MIVPIGPGSGPDAKARQLASKFPEFLGQPLIVENKAGAGGVIAGEAVAHAPADGYTLLLGTAATHVFIPLLMLKPPYKAEEDFIPITSLSKGYWVMAAITRRLHAEITRILSLSDIRNPIIDGGYEMGGESADEFTSFLRVQKAMWAKVIKEVNIQPR